jgi:hypothetical protein
VSFSCCASTRASASLTRCFSLVISSNVEVSSCSLCARQMRCTEPSEMPMAFGGSGNRDAPISPELLRRRPSSAGPRAHPEFKRTVLTDLAKADRDAAEAADGLAKTEKKTDLFTLAAPIDGIVQDLAVHTPAARKTVGGKRIAGIRPESQVRTRLSGGGRWIRSLVLTIFPRNPAIVRIFLDSKVENEVENPHHLRGFGYGSPSEKIAP